VGEPKALWSTDRRWQPIRRATKRPLLGVSSLDWAAGNRGPFSASTEMKFRQLNYSFVCSHGECLHQFEVPLYALAKLNLVTCPKCGSSRDITESKATGDISQIMRELTSAKKNK
jgi:hypothetical protein